jgi:hypothetical protein
VSLREERYVGNYGTGGEWMDTIVFAFDRDFGVVRLAGITVR